MGGGSWTTDAYTRHVSNKAAAGIPTFDHTDRIRTGRLAAGVNPLLDPRWANQNGPHAGQNIRELMFSDEHPNPTGIAVVLDVTGSNFEAAHVVHSKLPQLHGVLQRRGVEDPQVMVMAVGDAHSDTAPLQVGQFESDVRMVEQLEAMYLEGNGGGQRHETYELGAYFLARHTYLEPYERDGRKAVAFFIGDEMPYDTIRRDYGAFGYQGHTLESLTGDQLEADVTTAQIFAELQQKFDVFFLFQEQGSYRAEEILPPWRKLLGERALVLSDPGAVCEVIAMQMVMMESGASLDEAADDLLAIGADPGMVAAAKKALVRVAGSNTPAARTTGSLPTRRTPGARRI